MQTETDNLYMRRCIELAQKAEGLTYPNPMVGAVIVRNGRIIGEGFHRKAGSGHAEVNAVASVADKEALKESTMYVSLEPCAHYGRTPPCAELIIRTGIPNVVVGCEDSFSKVAGRGIAMLRDAGVNVSMSDMRDECRWLNRRFFTYNEKHRPYVILKWAQSADGFMARMTEDGNPLPVWLTNDACKTLTHRQRTTEQAIAVGVGTVIADNPQLTARLWCGNQPTRVIIDPDLRTPPTSRLLSDGGKTIVINRHRDNSDGQVNYRKRSLLHDAAADVLSALYDEELQSVIVEGGANTLMRFITAELWDEAFVYQSPTTLGNGLEAPRLPTLPRTTTDIDGCRLFWHVNHATRLSHYMNETKAI